MRRLENYVRKYGPEFGPVLYHALQSQAAHAGVSARLRRKVNALSGRTPPVESLPLFPGLEADAGRQPDPVAQQNMIQQPMDASERPVTRPPVFFFI